MEILNKAWAHLSGKKTYLISGLFVILAGLNAEGYLTPELYEVILTILGGLGLAAIRHGIDKK